MTISIRLDPETEAALRQQLRARGQSLSGFVRQAICEKLDLDSKVQSPYALGKHLFGQYDSGNPDLSTQRKDLIREKVHAKHHRRQRSADRAV